MINLMTIADIAGTIGMLLFLMAELKQFYKIKKTGKLTGISFHAYLSKLIAVMCTGICFALTGLYFSLLVIIGEGIIIIPVLYWLWKHRTKKDPDALDKLFKLCDEMRKRDKIKMASIPTDTKLTTSEEALRDLWNNKYDERWNEE